MAGITPLDPSIYNNVWRPDPMSGVDLQQKYLAIRHAAQENQLQQQDIQYRQGLSDAEAASSNPDGTQDTGKFNQIVMHDPRTAWRAQDTLLQGNQLNAPTQYYGTDENGNPIAKVTPAQHFRTLPGNPGANGNALSPVNPASVPTPGGVGPQLDPQAVQNAHDKVGALRGAATDLANNPNPTRPTAISTFSDLISKGHLTPQEAIQAMSDPKDPLPENPNEIQAWATRHAQLLGQKQQILNTHAPLPQPGQNAPVDPNAKITANSPTPQVPPSFAKGMEPMDNLNDILQHPEYVEKPHGGGGSPGVNAAAPMGFDQKLAASRDRINQVQNDASTVPQQNAIFNQIEDLSKSGAPTGDIENKIYKTLSEKGLVNPASTQEQKREEITKYMEQALLAAGMPATDAKLDALHSANVNPNQLPAAVQNLVSFFKASNEGKVLKQNYYNKTLNGSLNPDQEVAAKQKWDENYDPRIIEFKNLPTPEAKKEYLQDHPDFKSLIPKMKNLEQMGVL